MSDKTILVIDDSATIRKLVDSNLSPEGYRVVLAASADEGLKLADETRPDLILLDHQLPGTTGYEVCCRLTEAPHLKQIPVVVSSTLRKRAYAEYTELDNVVDMLPKPYTAELLKTCVANALDTAAMVVASQSHGTAVPEVIQEIGEAELSGSFKRFGLRELLDFLNNGSHGGVLEVEAERARIWFYLDKGRIQGVWATGISQQESAEILRLLPKSLENLAPVLKLTLGGRGGTEVEGFVQLLDRKVLDPRLMTKLLRYQAAMLVRLAFSRSLAAFRFEPASSVASLHRNLPLDISLLALLVEGALHCDGTQLIADSAKTLYARRAIRGQNLDRAGLSARHMAILNQLNQPHSSQQLATQLAWPQDEVHRVLDGFVRAELVEVQNAAAGRLVIFEPDSATAQQLRSSLESNGRWTTKVVRDALALQLVFRRGSPDAFVFAADSKAACSAVGDVFASRAATLEGTKRIAVARPGTELDAAAWQDLLGFVPDDFLPRPFTADRLLHCVEHLVGSVDSEASGETPRPADPEAAPTQLPSDSAPAAAAPLAPGAVQADAARCFESLSGGAR